MRMIAIAILVALLSGCTATYQNSPIREASAKLVKGTPVLIATPSDGSFESRQYPNSGEMTAIAVAAAFAPFSTSTKVSAECRDLACLERMSDASDYHYLVVPEILHWEDRATEWSGKPDRIEVRVTIFDSREAPMASTVIAGKSKWATFGGDHPQDLLHDPLTHYVEALY